MRRRLLNLLTALSLLLCLVVCALWIRSYRVRDILSVPLAQTYKVISFEGGLYVWSGVSGSYVRREEHGYALLTVTAIALPVARLWLKRRASALRTYRANKGLCLDCGYNLRATPGRCPECGAAIEGTSPA